MAFLNELKTNRLKLLRLFIKDRELVDLITCKTNVVLPAIDLSYTQIFPFRKVDKTVVDEKVFLCYGLTARHSGKATKNILIHIWIFMHDNLMQMSDYLRQDAIAARVESLLNGNEDMGVTDVEFTSLDELAGLPENFSGCYIQYQVKDINNICGDR